MGFCGTNFTSNSTAESGERRKRKMEKDASTLITQILEALKGVDRLLQELNEVLPSDTPEMNEAVTELFRRYNMLWSGLYILRKSLQGKIETN